MCYNIFTPFQRRCIITKQKKENGITLYGIIIGILMLALQHGIYLLCYDIARLIGITPFFPKIPAIDDAIKIVPLFIIPYVWAYAYWAMGPMAVSKCDMKHFKNFIAAYLSACILGGLILIFSPSYMDRVAEGLMDTSRTGFCAELMRFWYSLDGGDLAYNLFPSFHCINSTICYLGVMKRKEISLWFRIYSLITTLLIYASTLFVKQHFITDVIAGILVALIAYIACTKWNLGRVFDPIDKYIKKLFKKKA